MTNAKGVVISLVSQESRTQLTAGPSRDQSQIKVITSINRPSKQPKAFC